MSKIELPYFSVAVGNPMAAFIVVQLVTNEQLDWKLGRELPKMSELYRKNPMSLGKKTKQNDTGRFCKEE